MIDQELPHFEIDLGVTCVRGQGPWAFGGRFALRV